MDTVEPNRIDDPKSRSQMFVGVLSSVVCIDTTTGVTVWERPLGGGGFGEGFVALALDVDKVYAHTRGVLFCLERSSGRELWKNELKGKGYGTAFLCTDYSPSELANFLVSRQHRRSSGG